MANNRLFLLHKPSGLHIGLAKSYTDGWNIGYQPDMGPILQAFFDILPYGTDNSCEPNELVLVRECDEEYSELKYTFMPGMTEEIWDSWTDMIDEKEHERQYQSLLVEYHAAMKERYK